MQISVTCRVWSRVWLTYWVLVFEYLNEPWSVFHYFPSGAVACFVQQFLALSAWWWQFCFMLWYFTELKQPQTLPKKKPSWTRGVLLKEFLWPFPTERVHVYLGLPTVQDAQGVAGMPQGTKALPLDAKIESESRVALYIKVNFDAFSFHLLGDNFLITH